MARSFEVIWEALHEEGARFSGVLLDGNRGIAALFYSGVATRAGLLAWQKNKMKDPIEVQLVRYRSDEPMWGAELGADWDYQSLTSDQIYRAMRVEPLTFGGGRVLLRHTWADDRMGVVALDAEAGTIAWRREMVEPERSHVADSNQWMISFDGRKPPRLLDVRSGELRSELAGLGPDAEVVVLGETALALDDDGVLRAFGADGRLLWTQSFPAAAGGVLHDAATLIDGHVAVAEPGLVRALALGSGETSWSTRDIEEPRLTGRRHPHFLGVEDASTNAVSILHADSGRRVELGLESGDRVLHWTEASGRIYASTFRGAVVVIDARSGRVHGQWTRDDLGFVDVALVEGRLYATGIRPPQGPMALVELDPASGALLRALDLDDAGEVVLHALGASEIALLAAERGLLIVRS